MLHLSLLLLASAGMAVAESASGCETLTGITELLQADEGKSYCSSILNLGTFTNSIFEATTILETTTLTTPSAITLSTTTTQTETISSGTVTETAPLFSTTTTLSMTTTAFACPAPPIFIRDLGGQLAPYNEAKATSSPEPNPSVYEWDYAECDDDEEEEPESLPAAYDAHSMRLSSMHAASAPTGYVASPAAYDVHSMGPSSIYPASVPTAYAESSSTYVQTSSYIAHSTVPNQVQYPHAPGNASIRYPSGTVSSSHSLSTVLSDWHPQGSSNSSIPRPTGSTTSSHSASTTSTNSTTHIVTPTPAPEPLCETAPIALRSGHSCETVSAACGCLSLASATEDLTFTTTFTDVTYTTEAMIVTTITELTETLFYTVPAATLTLIPTSTVTETVLVTATSCPCSGSASSLCGNSVDTCKDLQTDNTNCGSCGNSCASGESCSAGTCVAPAVPEAPSCAASRCEAFIECGGNSGCICAATAEGSGVCITGDFCSNYQRCDASSDCPGADEKCAINTCCGYGICIKAADVCANTGSTGRMFRRKTWDGLTVGGGAF